MRKIIFITSLFLVFTFIGIEKMSAVTVPIYTNTGIVYITGGVDEDVYTPGEEIYATVFIDIGSSLSTSVGVSGSANGGSNSFFGGTYSSGYSGTQRKSIGIAQSTPGTYNANFSYSYNQAVPDPLNVWAYTQDVGTWPKVCYANIILAESVSETISFNFFTDSVYWGSSGLFNGTYYASTNVGVGAGSTGGSGNLGGTATCQEVITFGLNVYVNSSPSYLSNGRPINIIWGKPSGQGGGGGGGGPIDCGSNNTPGDGGGGPIDFEVPCMELMY